MNMASMMTPEEAADRATAELTEWLMNFMMVALERDEWDAVADMMMNRWHFTDTSL
jgi:hypothetical protein